MSIIRIINIHFILFLISGSKTLKKWFGKGPNCPTVDDLCERLDMVFIAKTKLGLVPCITGHKFHCMVRGEEVPPIAESSENLNRKNLQVVVMNLNQTHLRNQRIWGPEHKYRGHMEKTCRVPNWMFDNFKSADVVIVSNYFFPGCTKHLTMEMIFDYRGWNFRFFLPGSILMKEKLGIGIFSRYLLSEMDSYYFKCISGPEVYQYGFHFVQILKNTKLINIFTVKFKTTTIDLLLEQVYELKEFIMGRIMMTSYPFLIYSNIQLGPFMEANITSWIRNANESDYMSYLYDFKAPLRMNKTQRWGKADPKFLYCPRIRDYDQLKSFDLDCGEYNVFTEKLTNIPVLSTIFDFGGENLDYKNSVKLINKTTDRSDLIG